LHDNAQFGAGRVSIGRAINTFVAAAQNLPPVVNLDSIGPTSSGDSFTFEPAAAPYVLDGTVFNVNRPVDFVIQNSTTLANGSFNWPAFTVELSGGQKLTLSGTTRLNGSASTGTATGAQLHVADAHLAIGSSPAQPNVLGRFSVYNTGRLDVDSSLKLHPNPTVVNQVHQGGQLNIGGTTGNWIGTLDLASTTLIDDYLAGSLRGPGPSPLSTYIDQIKSGRNSGSWNGTGISSSSAALDSTRALGVGEASTILGPAGGTYLGVAVDGSAVVVSFTYYGDANLDHKVDVADLGTLASNWQMAGTWTSGDFDYSGSIDVNDLGLLASNWQAGVGNPLTPTARPWAFSDVLSSLGLPDVAVPEPAPLGLALVVAMARSRRRRG
jgi:hypothetical protein